MPSNKSRLYIALYPSGITGNEQLKYHWGFLIGPKVENEDEVAGRRCHVKNAPGNIWAYEDIRLTNVRSTINLLARILIAKIEDEQRLRALLARVPVVQDDKNFNCLSWVASAMAEIAKDGKCVGSAELNWGRIEAFGREYVAEKAAKGRYGTGMDMKLPKPTFDMLENKENVA